MENGRGRKEHQKMKPYLVYQYLLRNSDENHVVTAPELVGYLQEVGIYAERRSIYKDIEEINNALWILENDSDIEDVETAIAEGYFDDDKTIVYDNRQKGFYVTHRKYDAYVYNTLGRSRSGKTDRKRMHDSLPVLSKKSYCISIMKALIIRI